MKTWASLLLFLLVLTSCKDDRVAPPVVDLSGEWISHDPWAMSMQLSQDGSILSGQGSLFHCDACTTPPAPVTIEGIVESPRLHLTISDALQSKWIFAGTVSDPNTLVGALEDNRVTFERVGQCTERGCLEGLSIGLVPANNHLPAGHYDVRLVTVSGVIKNCCLDLGSNPTPCPDRDCVVWAVGAGRATTYVLTFPVVEGTIEAQVDRDGARIATDVFQPTYRIYRPNGPDCPPRCLQGSHDIVVH